MALPRWPRSHRAPLLGLLAAAPMAVALWGFTVDDALIIARYASNVAAGHGYRFNPDGAVTDGVTPLGWVFVMAPFGGGGPLGALRAGKLLGLTAWLCAAFVLGRAVQRAGERRRRYAALVLVACSAPLGAWSAAGMETGVVLALGGLAAAGRVLGRDRLGLAAAGLAAGLRPELLPWALVLALAARRRAEPEQGALQLASHSSPAPRRLELVLWAALPFVAVALLRLVIFGHAAPLSLYAKPSDFAHGWRYALACVLLTGVIAAVAWRRLDGWCRGLQLAIAAHVAAVVFAGGDWMPMSRLMVPVLPSVVVVAAHVLDRSHALLGTLRLGLGVAGLIFVMVRVGPSAARVGGDRLSIIRELGPALRSAQVVASLDIGWVGAATPATVIDLAGVTDPAVAALPGGHTSKRIPPAMLVNRKVDALVLLLAPGESVGDPWTRSRFARRVEQHVASLPAMADEFEVVRVSRHPRLPYVVVRASPGAPPWPLPAPRP